MSLYPEHGKTRQLCNCSGDGVGQLTHSPTPMVLPVMRIASGIWNFLRPKVLPIGGIQ